MKYSLIAIIVCGIIGWASEPLSLSNAYDLALKNEPHLRSLTLKTQATKEYIEQSKARLYPQVQGSVSWGSYEYEADYLRTPVKEVYSSYSLSASQPVYHRELWRGVDEAKARSESANYQLQAEEQKLGLDVAKAYFNLLRTQHNVQLFNSKKEFYQTKYQQLSEMLKLGLTNRMDVLEAKVASDKAFSEWLAEQKRSKVAMIRLEYIIKEPVGELPNFDFTKIDSDKLFQERTVWENKLGNNPNLKTSISSQEIAIHQMAIREADHYPKLDLSLMRKETFTQDTVAHKYDNQAIIQMSIPIYQGGYAQSRVREGVLLLDSAKEEVSYYQLESKLRFEELWAERQLNGETLLALKESEQSAELYLKSVDEGHKAGLKSVVDILEAKAKLYEIKRDTIDAGYELIANYLSLLDITGELNSENISLLEKMAIY
ncbi:MAG: TolC family protein [Sulfuricurvum sp.]